MATTRNRLVTGAMRQPLQFGLFSVVPLGDGPDHWEGGVTWETDDCAPVAGVGRQDCVTDEVGELIERIGLPKSLENNGTEPGIASPFGVLGYFTCAPVGYTHTERQDRAERNLITHEERRVEQALWTGDLGNTPALQSDDTETLLSGAAVKPRIGIAHLEDFIADNYGSLGVIHVSRVLGSFLVTDGVAEVRNGRLVTKLGTPIVAGAGYPGTGPEGQAVEDEASWAYVTPAVFGYRSEIFDSSAIPGDLFDRGRNIAYAVAERTYLLGYDPCGVGAVLIDPTL